MLALVHDNKDAVQIGEDSEKCIEWSVNYNSKKKVMEYLHVDRIEGTHMNIYKKGTRERSP